MTSFRRQIGVAIARAQGKEIVHFLHIGKTGGTVTKAALSEYENNRESRLVFRGHDDTLKHIPAGQKVVFFVRDPISRFISAFNSRLRQGRPAYFRPWSPAEEFAFAQFPTPNALALAIGSQDKAIRENAAAAMAGIQHVRDSYWKWFFDEGYFRTRRPDILFVGAQENLGAHLELLGDILRFSKSVSLPQDEVKSHKAPSNMVTHLDSEAMSNLARWYGDDYGFLEICRNFFKHLPQYRDRTGLDSPHSQLATGQ